MTHPDILKMERDGYLDSPHKPKLIGICDYCGDDIYDDCDAVESSDYIFCDIKCCFDYYGIRKVED